MKQKDEEHLKPAWQKELKYLVWQEAKEKYDKYLVSLQGKSDNILEELEKDLHEKYNEWILDKLNKASNINWGNTHNGKGMSIF